MTLSVDIGERAEFTSRVSLSKESGLVFHNRLNSGLIQHGLDKLDGESLNVLVAEHLELDGQ